MTDSVPITEFDVTVPSVARMYDFALGGKDNFEVDRNAVAKAAEVMPDFREVALENRGFLRRSVRHMVRQGIGQFIDIGSGLPTAGNTHEIAQVDRPDARVVYVDLDPVVLVHGRALLDADDNTAVVTADMRHPDDVLGHPDTRRLIDFRQPVGVLLIAMVHFLDDDEAAMVVRRLHEALPPGSYLTITHTTADGRLASAVERLNSIYEGSATRLHFRTHDELTALLGDFELVEPGIVPLDRWHPDPADPAPTTKWLYGAVARRN
jgi:O-methyltransferase involved in polyketide biosynthesis